MNNPKVILITTRYYPVLGPWVDVPLNIQLDFWPQVLFDFHNIPAKTLFQKKPAIKTMDAGHYKVFVAPCTDKTLDHVIKGKYLEEIIRVVRDFAALGQGNDDDLYLVAHDRDFKLGANDENINGAVVGAHQVPGNPKDCPNLNRLVDSRHAYMFQHGNEHKLGWLINEGKFNAKDAGKCVQERDCDALLKIIDEEAKMADFLRQLCADEQNVFPVED